MIVIFAFPSGK